MRGLLNENIDTIIFNKASFIALHRSTQRSFLTYCERDFPRRIYKTCIHASEVHCMSFTTKYFENKNLFLKAGMLLRCTLFHIDGPYTLALYKISALLRTTWRTHWLCSCTLTVHWCFECSGVPEQKMWYIRQGRQSPAPSRMYHAELYYLQHVSIGQSVLCHVAGASERAISGWCDISACRMVFLKAPVRWLW